MHWNLKFQVSVFSPFPVALESKLTEVLAVAYAVINKVFRKTGGRGLCCRLRFVTITGQMDK